MSTALAHESAPTAGALPPLLDAGDVGRLFGVERCTVLDWAKGGRLPKPIRFSRRVIRWRREAIEELLAGWTG